MTAEPNASRRRPAAPVSLGDRAKEEAIGFLKAAIWFLPLWIAFNTVAWAQYSIPSESMVPTMETGDRVLVRKFAYGYSRFSLPVVWRFLPEGEGRIFFKEPERGDVVVFAHPADAKTMIKRLIGKPGDTIELRGGILILNGVPARYEKLRSVVREGQNGYPGDAAEEFNEVLGTRGHGLMRITGALAEQDFGPVKVPAGHYFMMGDNRDNSQDSRFPQMGFVPAERLIGRGETVIFAPKGCRDPESPICTRARWLKPLALENYAPR